MVAVCPPNTVSPRQLDSFVEHILSTNECQKSSHDSALTHPTRSSRSKPARPVDQKGLGYPQAQRNEHHATAPLFYQIPRQYRISRQLGNCSSFMVSERYYLWYFENKLFKKIPPYLEIIKDVAMGSDVIISAFMALSAADLAVNLGDYVESCKANRGIIWAPKRTHELAAYQHVQNALTSITAPAGPDIRTLLAAHLILLFVELTLGTYSGLRNHISSIDTLVGHNKSRLQSTREGQDILRGIANARVIMKPLAGPWEPAGEENALWTELNADLCDPSVILQDIGAKAIMISQRFKVLISLKESLRQRNEVLEIIKDVADVLFPFSLFCSGTTVPSESTVEESFRADAVRLKALSQTMKDISWHFGAISVTERNAWVDLNGTDPNDVHYEILRHDPREESDLSPIHLESPEKAVGAIHYAFCHIMCDYDLVYTKCTCAPPSPAQSTTICNEWLRLLIRIIKGLPTQAAVENDFYRRGLSWLIFQAADHCNSVQGFDFLEEHMIRIRESGKGEEDLSFPMQAWMRLYPVFRNAVECGRRIIALEETPHRQARFSVHDTVLSGKVPAELIEHGIDADGQPYAERVALR
jgi:hypothetical protein